MCGGSCRETTRRGEVKVGAVPIRGVAVGRAISCPVPRGPPIARRHASVRPYR